VSAIQTTDRYVFIGRWPKYGRRLVALVSIKYVITLWMQCSVCSAHCTVHSCGRGGTGCRQNTDCATKCQITKRRITNAEFQNIELQNAELQNVKSYRTSNLTKSQNTKRRILQNIEIQNVDNTKRHK
jgi:hypothetical protein